MLKSLALGLLTLSATCATAAFAHGNKDYNYDNYYKWDNGQVNYLYNFDKSKGDGDKYWQDDDKYWKDDHDKCGKHKDCDDHDSKHEGDPASAPEIDPAGTMGALTLLLGGLAALRGRRSARATA